MGTLYKMDHTGHGEVSWNNKESMDAAKKLFDELKASGWMGTKTFPGTNKKAEQIRSFDPSADHIVMIPNFVGG